MSTKLGTKSSTPSTYQNTDNSLTIVVKLRKCPEEDGGYTETQQKHVEEEGHIHDAQLDRGLRGSAR